MVGQGFSQSPSQAFPSTSRPRLAMSVSELIHEQMRHASSNFLSRRSHHFGLDSSSYRGPFFGETNKKAAWRRRPLCNLRGFEGIRLRETRDHSVSVDMP
jgi:hypothetical protein